MEKIDKFYDADFLLEAVTAKGFDNFGETIFATKSRAKAMGFEYNRLVTTFSTLKYVSESDWFNSIFTNVEFDDLECEGGTISGKVLKKEHIRRVLANYFDMEIVGVSQKLCPSSIKHAPYLKADVLSNVVFLDCGEDLDKFSLIELSGYTV